MESETDPRIERGAASTTHFPYGHTEILIQDDVLARVSEVLASLREEYGRDRAEPPVRPTVRRFNLVAVPRPESKSPRKRVGSSSLLSRLLATVAAPGRIRL
jgi:hypothetical protein